MGHYSLQIVFICCDILYSSDLACLVVWQVFQDAIQSPSPAFRYFTSGVMPPLVKLKFSEPDGSRYISVMSNIIFSAEEQ